jgi:hypothetical protein
MNCLLNYANCSSLNNWRLASSKLRTWRKEAIIQFPVFHPHFSVQFERIHEHLQSVYNGPRTEIRTRDPLPMSGRRVAACGVILKRRNWYALKNIAAGRGETAASCLRQPVGPHLAKSLLDVLQCNNIRDGHNTFVGKWSHFPFKFPSLFSFLVPSLCSSLPLFIFGIISLPLRFTPVRCVVSLL